MDKFLTWLRVHFLSWLAPPKSIQVIDIIQILIIAYIVYRLIIWVRNTRAYALLRGILFILGFVVIARVLRMEAITWLLGNLSVAAITAAVIIFQPELRKGLEQMGHSRFFSSVFSLGSRNDEDNLRFSEHTINELVRASFDMAEVKTGALIVLERDISLSENEKTGIPVDAVLTSQLLINIFEHNTPLHDGAVIVRGNRVAAATCYLPLSENMELSKRLGTRHRAGLGISEATDSLTIIVSEETGGVSYAMAGKLTTGVSPSDLREKLHEIQKIREDSLLAKKRRERRDKADAEQSQG